MQEHLYLGKSHCQPILNSPSRHLQLKDSREAVPGRKRTVLHQTGIFPQPDSSHCEFPVRELPLGIVITLAQSKTLLRTGNAVLRSARFS